MVKLARLQISLSKRILLESFVLLVIIIAGVWFVFGRPSPNDSGSLPCETCPITDCGVYAFLSSFQEYPSSIVNLGGGEGKEKYQVGGVVVDKDNAEIIFVGSVNKASQTVHFLVLPSLPDVQIDSPVTAEVKLIDLQNAIALLDWQYLEQLRTTNDAPLELLVQWYENGDTKSVRAAEIVRGQRLKLGDLIFLGTEIQWQEMVMVQPGLPSACPVALPQGELPPPAYKVDSSLLPSSETEVTLLLRMLGR
jgi:hypothetical protein